MEYIHYWRRAGKFNAKQFGKVVRDFNKAMKELSAFVPLANVSGRGRPQIGSKMICFNGVADCGHTGGNSGIACQDEKAREIVSAIERHKEIPPHTLVLLLCEDEEDTAANDIDGSGAWFAALKLGQRFCHGNCSHKDFSLPLEIGNNAREKPVGKIGYYGDDDKPVCRDRREIGLYFDFCDTAGKIYDLAVMACLIIAKHHLKDQIIVGSTVPDNWPDAMLICQKVLGYGFDFDLDRRAVK